MFPFCFLPINLWTKVWCSVTIVLDHYYGITMIESSVTEFQKPDLIVWTNNFGAFFVGSVYPDLLYIDVSIVLAPSILTYMAKTFKISTITINLQTGVLLQPFPLLQWPAQGIYYKIIFVTLFANNFHQVTFDDNYCDEYLPDHYKAIDTRCKKDADESQKWSEATAKVLLQMRHKSEIKLVKKCFCCVTKVKSSHCKRSTDVSQKLVQKCYSCVTKWLL